MTSRRFALKGTLAGFAGMLLPVPVGTAGRVSQGGREDGKANVHDFGARGDGSADDTAAIQRAIDSLPRGGVVYLPAGTYRITRTLRIAADGVAIEGAGGHTAGSAGSKPTTIAASGIPGGSSAIRALGTNPGRSMAHVKFRRFYLAMEGSGTGGAGLLVGRCSNVEVEDISLDVMRGPTSVGIQFGDLQSSQHAVIVSGIRGCTVGCDGTPILIGVGCTSISIDHSYALNASVAGVVIKSASYCALTACAVDSGRAGAFGYRVLGSTGIVLSACGAERNGKGFLSIADRCVGVTAISCRGVDNNRSGDTGLGSFVDISGAKSESITLIGCVDSRAHRSTTTNVRGGTPSTTIIGSGVANFPQGIKGNVVKLG